jgi:hypothetical protein
LANEEEKYVRYFKLLSKRELSDEI